MQKRGIGRSISIVLVLALLGVLPATASSPSSETSEESPPPPPPPQMVSQQPQMPPPKPDLPFAPLPRGRGQLQDHYLNTENLNLNLPSIDDLKGLTFPLHLDGVESIVPRVDLAKLSPAVSFGLPKVDLSAVNSTISDLLAKATGSVDGVINTVTGIGAGIGTISQGQEQDSIPAASPIIAESEPETDLSADKGSIVDSAAPEAPAGTAEFATNTNMEESDSSLSNPETGTIISEVAAAPSVESAPSTSSEEHLSPSSVNTTPVQFQLTTIANGTTKTFDLVLCVPTPINIENNDPLLQTTLVSLCPVPLGVIGSVPAVAQPLQLYLSIQRLPAGTSMSATFIASYNVPDPVSPTESMLTVNLGLASTSQDYPAQAVVGAATDYNPVTNTAAQSLTASWVLNGTAGSKAVDSVFVEAVDVGKVDVRNMPTGQGRYSLSYIDGRFTSEFKSDNAFPSNLNPSVQLTVRVPSSNPSVTNTGLLTWSEIPQHFTFNFQTTQLDGKPSGISFDGTQVTAPNLAFYIELEYRANEVLAGLFRQSGFGDHFSEWVEATRDENGNISGMTFRSITGQYSTLDVSSYIGGTLAGFVELVHIPPLESEIYFQLAGTAGDASAGVSIHGTSAPDYIGAASYLLPDGSLSASQQAAMKLATGVPPGPIPFSVNTGEKLNLAVSEVNPTFRIDITYTPASTSETGTDTVRIWGGSSGASTASQLILSSQIDLTHRATILFNSLGADWVFQVALRGTTEEPSGIDLWVVNVEDNPEELKQIYVTESGTPIFTLTVKHPQSDLTGYISPGGIQAMIFDPPYNFRLSLDRYRESSAEGGTIFGINDSSRPGGYLELLIPGDPPITARIDEPFKELGEWWAVASASHDTGTYNIEVYQSWGYHPDGKITLSQVDAEGGGRLVVKSFAQTTRVTVQVFRQAGYPYFVYGGQVVGANSGSNPDMEIHLDVLEWNSPMIAVNILGTGLSESSAYEGEQLTAIATKVPSNFDLTLTRPTKDELHIESINPQPAPEMTIKLFSGRWSYPKVKLVIRSFDVKTTLDAVASFENGILAGGGKATLTSYNLNPNLTHVISAILTTESGSSFTVLFWRPSGDTSGLPTSGTGSTILWNGMPKEFVFNLKVASTSTGTDFSLDIKDAIAAPDSILRIQVPSINWNAVFRGTGANQTFKIDLQSTINTHKELTIFAEFPVGFRNIQLYELYGDWNDKLLSLFRSGPVDTNGTQRGMEIWIIPNEAAWANTKISVVGREVTFDQTSSGPGVDIDAAIYYQNYLPTFCIWSGTYHPCTAIHLWNIPQKAHLAMTPPNPSEGALLPALGYNATDSNLILWVDALTPGVGGTLSFNGMPKSGVVLKMTPFTDPNFGFTIKSAGGATEPLPDFYMDAYNLEFAIDTGRQKFGGDLGWGFGVLAVLEVLLHYKGSIEIWGDSGIIEARGKKDGTTIGIMVRGTSNQTFAITFNMFTRPDDYVAWFWEGTWLDTFEVDSDEDSFVMDASDLFGILSFYTWEAVPNDSSHRAGTGCTASPSAIDMEKAAFGAPTIPFQPTFPLINNAISVCAGHVAYYTFSPQDLPFKHCRSWMESCSNEFSYADFLGIRVDWVLATYLKHEYGETNDPLGLVPQLGGP